MFRFLRQHRTVVMIALALCVGALLLFQAGGASFMSSAQDTWFKVNGEKVSQSEFLQLYQQVQRQHQNAPQPPTTQQMAQTTLQQIVRDRVFYAEAERYGVSVSDQELQRFLASAPAFQRDGHFDPATYARAVNQIMGTSISDFETMQRRELMIQHLHNLVASSVHISDADVEAAIAAGAGKEEKAKDEKEKPKAPLTPEERFEKVRQDLREKEMNRVYSDWLTQLNSKLRVTPPAEPLQRLLTAPPSPASAPAPIPK